LNEDGEFSKLRSVSHPSDWVFVFGCPSSWWRFKWAQSVGEFCPRFSGWSEYKKTLLAPFRSLYLPIREMYALQIQYMPDVKGLTKCLSRHRNIVLFTHCDRVTRRVELREGMVGYDELLKCIPQDFDGIVDLSVCKPVGLPEMIKSRAPRTVVRATTEKLDAVGWLHFYAHLFLTLGERKCSYSEALLETTNEFRRSASSARRQQASGENI
jgi:hypothetical protein